MSQSDLNHPLQNPAVFERVLAAWHKHNGKGDSWKYCPVTFLYRKLQEERREVDADPEGMTRSKTVEWKLCPYCNQEMLALYLAIGGTAICCMALAAAFLANYGHERLGLNAKSYGLDLNQLHRELEKGKQQKAQSHKQTPAARAGEKD